MKKTIALLVLLSMLLLLCACTPNDGTTEDPQTPDAPIEDGNGDGNGDGPDLPFEGGHDPNGWT